MNIPWKVSEKQSSQVGSQVSPVPTTYTVFGPVDVRGYDWIEFSVKVANNIGGTPVTILEALIDYGEDAGDLAGDWFTLTTEDVDVSGVAQQEDYNPRRGVSGASVIWRIPVPVHGQVMRLRVRGNNTPDASSTIDVYAYRRSF
jgi:hypothetical protein